MLIWILALVLLLASAALGYTWGAIRVGITTIGLVIAAALAVPVSPILYPMFTKLGMGTQVHAIFISPFIVMIVVMIVFKIIASTVHQKVDTHFKYHAAEYVQTLWTRANDRFGAALALVNATIYLFIVCSFISVISYPVSLLSSREVVPISVTVKYRGNKVAEFQSSGMKDSTSWQWLLKFADDLKSTKMDRAVAAFDPAPKTYYNVCDMLGMVYQNPLLVGRLTSYPPIMALGERDEFRPMFDGIANDKDFAKKLFETPRPAFQELMGELSFQMIVTNKPFMKELFKLDFKDLSNYLATGSSAKFDEKLLGRWHYDPDASLREQMLAMSAQNPKIKWTAKVRDSLTDEYKKVLHTVTFVGLLENQCVYKSTDVNQGANVLKGTYENKGGGKYEITADGPWGRQAEMRGTRLITTFKPNANLTLVVVFEKE